MSDIFSTLVIDRGSGATYGIDDTNRVGSATALLAQLLTAEGYVTTVNVKTDWAITDIYYVDQLETYLGNVKKCKIQLVGAYDVPLPEDVYYWDYEDANNIERCLIWLRQAVDRMRQAYIYCGTVNCGGDILL